MTAKIAAMPFFCMMKRLLQGQLMRRNLFWLNDEQRAKIEAIFRRPSQSEVTALV
jgi:hypothetical protein